MDELSYKNELIQKQNAQIQLQNEQILNNQKQIQQQQLSAKNTENIGLSIDHKFIHPQRRSNIDNNESIINYKTITLRNKGVPYTAKITHVKHLKKGQIFKYYWNRNDNYIILNGIKINNINERFKWQNNDIWDHEKKAWSRNAYYGGGDHQHLITKIKIIIITKSFKYKNISYNSNKNILLKNITLISKLIIIYYYININIKSIINKRKSYTLEPYYNHHKYLSQQFRIKALEIILLSINKIINVTTQILNYFQINTETATLIWAIISISYTLTQQMKIYMRNYYSNQ